jgi:hypothetical protein
MTQQPAPTRTTPLQAVLDQIDLDSSGAAIATLTAVTDIAIEIAREGREGRADCRPSPSMT